MKQGTAKQLAADAGTLKCKGDALVESTQQRAGGNVRRLNARVKP
jgi:hypothetical protein